MIWLRRLLLLFPWNRRAREQELEEELRANLALAEEDARSAAGPVSSAEAQRLARRDFGSLAIAREQSRAVWLPGWDGVCQDVRFSIRSLRRAPAFTTVAVLSLALGIGAASALFSLVNAVVLKPLAYREPGRLLFVREVVKPLAHIYPTLPVNYQHFRFWRENARSFESIAALMSGTVLVSGGGDPEPVGIATVSSNFFDTLGVEPRLGRGFLSEEEAPRAQAASAQEAPAQFPVVISASLWRRRFGASPAILGRKILINGYPARVVGVLPASFRFPKNGDLGPLAGLPERTDVFAPVPSYMPGWGGDYDYIVFGRLRPGVTQAEGTTELNLLEQRIVENHPGGVRPGLSVATRPLEDVIASPVRASLAVLLAAVLLLVLIVCVNLANLLLARGSARAREYAMRVALGAARGRLVISALIETMLLSLSGGALGAAGACAAVGTFVRLAPIDLPRADEVQAGARVLAFTFGLSLVCALLFGLLPALRLAHADPQAALRGEGHGATAGRAGLRLREWLVGGEVALSALLLVLAGLLVNSLWHVLHVERGFASDRTLDISFMLPAKYNSVEARAAFFDRAAAALAAIPGVRAAAAINRPPLTGESNVNEVDVDGGQSSALDPVSRQTVMVNDRFAGDGYFAAIGIPLVRGRVFEPADRGRNVAVISARLAAKLFPGQNPLGHSVSSGSLVKDARIVGVVGDVHTTKLDRDPTMMIYVPFWKSAYQVSDMALRAAIDPAALEPQVRRAIHSIDAGVPTPRMRTMEELVEKSVAQRRFQMDVAAAFGIAALLLAALGIYGVVAYSISLRRRELGIRMALGARRGHVRRIVLGRGLAPVAAGLLAGLLAALAAGRLVRSLLFGVAPTDPWTLAVAAATLGCVAVLACLAPARSAARIDPARVLRDE